MNILQNYIEIIEVCKDLNLTINDAKLIYLIGTSNNFLEIKQNEIANTLRISIPTIRRSINKLVKRRIIIRKYGLFKICSLSVDKKFIEMMY